MKSAKDIKEILKQEKSYLSKKYGVTSIGLFGSYVRNEQSDKSDIDILIELNKPISLFGLLNAEFYLEDRLGKKVDLVLKRSLKKHIGEYILNEVQYI